MSELLQIMNYKMPDNIQSELLQFGLFSMYRFFVGLQDFAKGSGYNLKFEFLLYLTCRNLSHPLYSLLNLLLVGVVSCCTPLLWAFV